MPQFEARDGAKLAYRETGAGSPLILFHGLTSTATMAWIDTGHAEVLATRGHRVIMPDLRGHGDSVHRHALPDALADDGLALVEHLGLDDYDLGGYSLGGRVVARMLVRGATPRRAIIGGQGTRQLAGEGGGAGDLVRHVADGTVGAESPMAQWLKKSGADVTALVHVLDSLVPTGPADLAAIRVPTLVVAGEQDTRAASAKDLAEALPDATYVTIPGDHGSAAANPALAEAMADFLARG